MKRFFCILLTLTLLLSVPCAFADRTAEYYASLYTPYELDVAFKTHYDFLSSSWKQTFSSGYGMSAEYAEEARFDGHHYYFRVVGNGDCIAEISFTGWYSDMMMIDGLFKDGLYAYTAYLRTAKTAVPEGDQLEEIISGYDIWSVMDYGHPFYWTSGGWSVTVASRDVLEIIHTSGAYVLISVRDGYFNAIFQPV